MKKFYAFLAKYYPEANKLDGSVVYGYGAAQTLVKVLQMCGDDLTRANVMKQAASLKDFEPDTMLPGVKINTVRHRLCADLAAAAAAFQGREVGLVRRRHERRRHKLIFRRAGIRSRIRLKNEPPATPSQGAFCCWDTAEGIQCRPTAAKRRLQKRTIISDPGRSECLLSNCEWGPSRLPSRCLLRPAALPLRRRNTTSAPPTPKSRSATSCRIAGPASAYGVIGKTEAGLLQEDQRRGRHQRPQDQLRLL